ncbi:hypothetical protein Tco_1193543 [Tanacetum coccineum]
MLELHHCVIDHLESVKDCPAGGWLERLNVNHEEDSAFLEALNDLVEKLSAAVRMKEKDVSDMEGMFSSQYGPEFTWEREDQFRKKYPHLFTKTAPSSTGSGLVGGVVFGVVGVGVSASVISGSLIAVVERAGLGGIAYACWIGFCDGGAGNRSGTSSKTVSKTKSGLLEVLIVSNEIESTSCTSFVKELAWSLRQVIKIVADLSLTMALKQ